MGFFSRRKVELKEKQKIDVLEKMKLGLLMNVTLPEVETVSHGMVTKGVATGVFGLVGLAMTMGSSNQLRKIRTGVRFPENGIVIENGTVDGKDIKIPWKSVINATNKGGIIDINLDEGETIQFGVIAYVHPSEYGDFITDYINEHANGQVEDGW